MATHLPPEELLTDYARGATTPGLALLVASHLERAEESRGAVAAYERVGGALLQDSQPIEMSAGSLDAALAELDALSCDGVQREIEAGPLPKTLADEIGIDFADIPWKFRLPGVSEYTLEGFGGEKVALMRARPGTSVPQHTHRGPEVTLVLQGCMLDEGIEYHAGDVAVNDEEDDHRPRILGEEICYCLIVQQGDLHFTGRFSRLLNYIGE